MQDIVAERRKEFLTTFLTESFSDIHSAIISSAPFIALSVSLMSLFKNLYAISSISSLCCDIIIFARGSNPLLRAISARVRRFGLNGIYISSSSCADQHSSILFFTSPVSFPVSPIEAKIVALRLTMSSSSPFRLKML